MTGPALQRPAAALPPLRRAGAAPPMAPAAGQTPRPRRLEVMLAGAQARRAVAGVAAGRVAGVFRRGFYLQNSAGAYVCIGGAQIGAGALSALVEPPAAEPVCWEELVFPGQPFSAAGGEVAIGDSLLVSFRGATAWQPPLPRGSLRPPLLRRHLHLLRGAARGRAPAGGLAFLMEGIAPADGDGLEALVACRGLVAAGALAGWLTDALAEAPATSAATKLAPPPAAAGGLLGLGPGLTPSGDDLVGGVLLALHALPSPRVAGALGRWALALARRASPPISGAQLAAAAQGQGAEALHQTLRGLGRDPGWHPAPHLRRLAALGHTSGWDALAGIWLALNAVCSAAGRDCTAMGGGGGNFSVAR